MGKENGKFIKPSVELGNKKKGEKKHCSVGCVRAASALLTNGPGFVPTARSARLKSC